MSPVSQSRRNRADALRICGDATTRRQLENWSRDPIYRNEKKRLEAAATLLGDPKRRLPRDLPVQTPLDLDLLCVDFLITGEYFPISRILDTLDQPGNLRQKINDWLKKNPANQEDLLETLSKLNLIQPGTKDKLIPGDLELILFHDDKGRFKSEGADAAFYIGKEILNLSEHEIVSGFLLQGIASWLLQENLKEQPKVEEQLRNHFRERPARSQDLIKRWLRIDQPKVLLDKESERLQGTWQAISWEDEEGNPHEPKVEDPKVKAEILKFARWKFEDNEWLMTRAFTVTTNEKTVVKGKGSTTVATYKIDASRNPKEMTATGVGQFGEKFVIRAIYKFEGDVLLVCMSKNDRMPKDFSGKKGSGCILVTLRKVTQP